MRNGVIDMNNEFKLQLIETGLFKKRSSRQYTCGTCPYCGDMKSHVYVLIDQTQNTPVLYHCKKCHSGGRMNKKFLEYFGITNIKIPKDFSKKIHDTSSEYNQQVMELDPNNKEVLDCAEYIQTRVGHKPTVAEMESFQFIQDPRQYAKDFLETGDEKQLAVRFKLDQRFWFRMANGGMIGRSKNPNDKYRWYNYQSTRLQGKGLYSLKVAFDPRPPINVFIAEGTFDLIGLYYHYPMANRSFIAAMGSGYQTAVMHLITKGIYGEHVHLHIFKDADVKSVSIDKLVLQLFGNVSVYRNRKGKDYGMLPNEVKIEKVIRGGLS